MNQEHRSVADHFSRRTVLLHDLEELDDDLGGRADKDLALAAALSVGNVHESVVKDGDQNHLLRNGD